ncbi:MAG: NUDIX domain-containing protein [Clostridia bacterium]|nr:NUDIX domain-containing protein [Clostridia bacterium]
MEIWDAYLADGSLAGCDLIRGEPVPEGLYHLVGDILVRHRDGDYLLMKRDPQKPNYGGWFEATAGGSALKGEDAYACARRELREETGITDGELTPIGRYVHRDTIYIQHLCITGQDKASITLQEGETVAYRWLTEAEFAAFVNSEDMIPGQRERFRAYYEQMGYLKREEE